MYKNPIPTVDIIIEIEPGRVVLIKRSNPPFGWAIPGGFVDYGESLEQSAIREAKEETGIDVQLLTQLHTYSDPERDPRFHTISTVYIARRVGGALKASSDAKDIGIFSIDELPQDLAFDHKKILQDYRRYRGI
jgi:ADP-ribose pyrophosphatase YjhB (NUDIX family)